MSSWAITTAHLGKRYPLRKRINSYPTLRGALDYGTRRWLNRLRNRHAVADPSESWALRDLSVEVPQGQALGIIGSNGAGKSTLLRILTRITKPTTGKARIWGRVGSLLEVGAGFHPELTGRENIFLNGAILGMTRADTRARFEQIVEFAQIGAFLDTPLKHYSSGMGVRLAFSVAAHLEPDVLLVDEVLAVGDRAFQQKCIGKIGEVTQAGRTVLFVSHDLAAVANLTTRCLMLSAGCCQAEGPTTDVINTYLTTVASGADAFVREDTLDAPHIRAVTLRTTEPNNRQRFGAAFGLDVELCSPRPLHNPTLSIQILSQVQQPVLHLFVDSATLPALCKPGCHHVRCEIPRLHLFAGRYTLRARIYEGLDANAVDHVENICPFEITLVGVLRDRPWQSKEAVYLEDASWTVTS